MKVTPTPTSGAADLPEALRASHGQAPAPADSVTAPAGVEDDDIDAVALARYKVVPAHESMFHRFAVVAGDGKQQLYLGREVECENMARKFAGAFLDGAFYQANITPPTQSADSVPAPAPPPECETEAEKRAFAFGWFKALESERMKADSVQEDAACWQWLAEYLVGTRTDLDDEIVASETVNDLRKLVEAAIKQGSTP